jgi:hypothetical protein
MRNVESRTLLGRFGWALVIAGALVGTTGCKKLLKKGLASVDAGAGTTTAGNGTAGSGATADDPDDLLEEKIQAYIVCQNTLSSRIYESRNRYFSWVSPDKPLTGKESYQYGLYEVPAKDAQACSQNVEKARKLAPAIPKLEGLASEYAAATSEVATLSEQANKYYDQKDWRDDKWVKGKDLDPKLKAAWKRFNKVDHELHDELAGITKPLARRRLAQIDKEEGKKFLYHRKNVLLTSRELVEAGAVDEDIMVDFALYESAFKDFDTALTDLITYGSAHKADLSKSRTVTASTGYDQFTKNAEDFRKKSKEQLRCLRDAPAKARTGTKVAVRKLPSCRDGSRAEVVKEYNDFIDVSNRWKFP